MIILALRTDKPDAEIGVYDGHKHLVGDTWHAHRQLAETLHLKIHHLLEKNNLEWSNVEGLVVYEGPGSFTGLRIGLSVANALAYSREIPIISIGSDDWISKGIERIFSGHTNKVALPVYGSPVHTTSPNK